MVKPKRTYNIKQETLGRLETERHQEIIRRIKKARNNNGK